MTELLEKVAVVAGKDDDSCPFPHREKEHDKKNKMKNDSTTLKNNLGTESKSGTELILPHKIIDTISTGGEGTKKNYTMTYNPHHIMPGNASWPETALLKWINKGTENHVKGDIGYDVNGYKNGIDLPSSNYLRGNWTTRTEDFQNKYAIASMDTDTRKRQFHDSHEAYSDFAKEVLDKMAAKLDVKPSRDKGCGDEKCCAGKKKPFAPPYKMLPRIDSAARRLASHLHGDPKEWKQPIMTSKFSLIYKNRNLTHKEATEAMRPEKYKYGK